jgi:hypothetical protein
MLDSFIGQLEECSAEGALVLLKWDGERAGKRHTVVITRADTDFVWRQDSDDMAASLDCALTDYRAAHPR